MSVEGGNWSAGIEDEPGFWWRLKGKNTVEKKEEIVEMYAVLRETSGVCGGVGP